ncbi:MAG: GGDEF domain-containing protein [Pseudomonadota bacterium]
MEKFIMRFGAAGATAILVAIAVACSTVVCALGLWVSNYAPGSEVWRFALPASALIALCVSTPLVQSLVQSNLRLMQSETERRQLIHDANRVTGERRDGDGCVSVLMLDVAGLERAARGAAVEELRSVIGYVNRVVEAVTRQVDVCARYGEDGFICLLPNTGQMGAQVIAERVKSGLIRGKELGLETNHECRIGIVTMAEGESMDELLERADQALDIARRGGEAMA